MSWGVVEIPLAIPENSAECVTALTQWLKEKAPFVESEDACFVHIQFPMHHIGNKHSRLPLPSEMPRLASPTHGYHVLYTRHLLSGACHMHGMYIAAAAAAAGQNDGGVSIGSLTRDAYNRAPLDTNTWYVLPAQPLAELASDCAAPIQNVNYRATLMNLWWEQRNNSEFVERDSLEMLALLHTPATGFFDLSSPHGRRVEYATYWALAFTVGHDAQLWPKWLHWEHSLMQFRFKTYFNRQAHLTLFLEKDPTGLAASVINVVDPGDRERELFVARSPRGTAMPGKWISVPYSEMNVLTTPFYDVDAGRIIITHHDFFNWAWCRARAGAQRFIRSIHVHAYGPRIKNTNPSAQATTLLHTVLASTRSAKQRDEDAANQQRKLQRMQMQDNSGSGDENVILTGNTTELIDMARRHFPPCMAQHVYQALVNGRHPKNEARLALSMFLIEAGFTVSETERVIYLLYEADGKFVRDRYGRSGWTEAAFKREYGGQVAQLHTGIIRDQRVGAFGCKALTSPELAMRPHGCPLVEMNKRARPLLEWLQAPPEDIEDVMRFNHPQERCSRHFEHVHPDDVPFAIRHPNAFFRRRAAAGNKTNNVVVKQEIHA